VITAVDANVLFDLLIPDPVFGPPSRERMRTASREGALVIGEVVYAEIAGFFAEHAALDAFLGETGVALRPSSSEAFWRAGTLWRTFCRDPRRAREHSRRILADFLIGAHAFARADRLLTRDRDFYRAHFNGLKLA